MSRWPTGLLGVLWHTQYAHVLITDGVAARADISRVRVSRVMPFELAVVLAYGFGTLSSRLRARWIPFALSGRTMTSETPGFAFVSAVAFAPVWIVSVGVARVIFLALRFTWHADGIGHLMGVALSVSTALDHRHYTCVRKMP